MKALRIFSFLLIAVLVFSCKPQVPDKYLQPDEFEDILYDYHLADAMADNSDNVNDRPYNITLYREAVLKKYGITQADFDSSLVYYMRHSDRMHAIYENLTKRFEDDALALGASANDVRRYGDMKSSRDTSNLWTGAPAAMLMPVSPYNVMSFEIAADSTYHKGDKIIFSFNCDFVYQNNTSKEGVALLAVQFTNDSIASSTVRMSSNSSYSVTVYDRTKKGIKAVRGFIYLGSRQLSADENSNDLRIMFVDNMRLVKMRDVDATGPSVQPSVAAGSGRDSSSVRNPQAPVTPSGSTDVPASQVPNATKTPLKMSDVAPVMRRTNVRDKR